MTKNIVLGVSGSIAAYKALLLIRKLKTSGYNIIVIATTNALKFVGEISFATLSENPVIKENFNNKDDFTKHISLSKWADLFITAPASANFIAKAANGISDDFLSTFNISFKGKKLIAPAMNKDMYHSPQNKNNMKRLKEYGYKFIESQSGFLACGDIGDGRLADIDKIMFSIEKELTNQDLKGTKILINGGRTIEPIDPVRYITNNSTGYLGKILCETAAKRGAKVTYVRAVSNYTEPLGAKEIINIKTSEELYNASISNFGNSNITICSAAVSDYTPKFKKNKKIKKKSDTLDIPLVKTKDTLYELGKIKKDNQVLIGFALESENKPEYAKIKLNKKNLDTIVFNSLQKSEAFGSTKNIYDLIDPKETIQTELISKQELANILLSKAKKMYENKN